MGEDRVAVLIVDQSTGKRYRVILPTNVQVNRVLPALIKQLGLAIQGRGGAPIRYNLLLKTNVGHVSLQENATLFDAGIEEGALLQITPEMRAGNWRKYELLQDKVN